MTNKNTSVGILGGGISGLSTAYGLAKEGVPTTIYEQQHAVGGAIRTIQEEGWLIEEGPNTLMVKSQAVWELLTDIGLTGEIQEANELAKKRFVVKNNTPVALPNSLGSFLRTPLLSATAKLRLLKEPFVAPASKQDETIASFIKRRLGTQPLDYGINPFVSGIFAGDPKELSVKHTFDMLWKMEQRYGSILKGMLKRGRSNTSVKRSLISFTNGNQMLAEALANSLSGPVETSTTITSARKVGEQWQLSGIKNGEHFTNTHDALISTLPTYTLPDIFGPRLFGELAELPYAPLSVLALGFRQEQLPHPLDGFGMLIPEVENYKTLGALFSSTLFPGRAPEGHHLLTCFIGGDRNPMLASKSQDELTALATKELKELLGVKGNPVFTHHTYWEHAIPQYKLDFDHYLTLMNEIEKQHSGLYLAGNYRYGVSVPDCISSGLETAQKTLTFLRSNE